MKQGWDIKKLGDLCNLMTGGTPSRSKKEYFEGGTIKWLVSGDIHKREIYDCEGRITELGMVNSNAKLLPVNSVMIALNGQGKTRGTVAILRTNATCNQSLVSIYPKDTRKVLPEFIFCNLHGRYEEIRKITGDDDNDRRGLNMPLIRNIEIPLPPLPEQQRIVYILDEAFAAIAKAKANAEQNLKNAKELFESYLQGVFENKGDGWEELSVRECVENGIIFKPLDGNHGEIHPTKTDFVSSGIPFIMARDMKNGGVDENGCNFITEAHAKTLRTGFAKDGDVLLSHKGTIGAVSILKTARDFIVLTPQITYYRIKNKEKLIKEFLFYYFLNPSFQREINSIAAGGSTRAYIGITKQLELNLAIAPLKEQQTIVRQLDVLRAETQKLEAVYQKKVDDLEELKKSILRKAFAGELKTGK